MMSAVQQATRPRVILTRRVPMRAVELLKRHCEIRHWDSEEPIPRSTLLEWVRSGVEGLFVLLTERVDEELILQAGPTLRVVSTMSVGYDHVNLDALHTRGIPLGYTPGVLTETTADLTMALLLATARRIPEAVAAVKEGAWSTWKPEWMAGRDVHGSCVGIVGMGRIGEAVARRLQGFKCQLLYTDTTPRPEVADPLHARFVDLPTLLAHSDFVTVHLPLCAATTKLFGRDLFRQMKSTGIFINTSRGGIVDQDALYDALHNKRIAAAGLDVTSPEPLPVSHPLLTLPNCVVLPHIGSASFTTRERMAIMAAENCIAGVTGHPLPHEACPFHQ